MSQRRREERRKEVAAVRADAYYAARSGRSIESCPYEYCDRYQWRETFTQERGLMQQERKEQRLQQIALIEEAEVKEKIALELRVAKLEQILHERWGV
jgi:hypothetical protein